MRRLRSTPLVFLSLALLVASCNDPSFREPTSAKPATLGELVYRVLRSTLEGDGA